MILSHRPNMLGLNLSFVFPVVLACLNGCDEVASPSALSEPATRSAPLTFADTRPGDDAGDGDTMEPGEPLPPGAGDESARTFVGPEGLEAALAEATAEFPGFAELLASARVDTTRPGTPLTVPPLPAGDMPRTCNQPSSEAASERLPEAEVLVPLTREELAPDRNVLALPGFFELRPGEGATEDDAVRRKLQLLAFCEETLVRYANDPVGREILEACHR